MEFLINDVIITKRSGMKDRKISNYCFRGSHAYSLSKDRCKGRTCVCWCHGVKK